jgi:hypothetical protein
MNSTDPIVMLKIDSPIISGGCQDRYKSKVLLMLSAYDSF